MALKTVTSLLCDRCGNTIEEVEDAGAGERQANTAVLALEMRGDESIVFDDLCSKCLKRVGDLVGQIRLEKKEKTNGVTEPPPPEDAPEEVQEADAL